MYCIACPPVLQLFDGTSEILDDWAIDGFEFAARGHDRYESGNPVNRCPELRFALTERGFAAEKLDFGFLGFIDIYGQAIPLDDASLLIAQRFNKNVVSTKRAVRAT